MKQLPVIFLAFANDRTNTDAYLRNLPQELNGIRKALQPAVQAGLCELVERANASIEQVLDVFQDEHYRGRIAIFHYGGHASSYQLLLETASGAHSHAHSEGLVSFLARQHGLKMVFLNGCSSQQQALDLMEAGLSAVVGTAQSISDDTAMQLAIRFYKGLAQGNNLQKAWLEAEDEVKITKGGGQVRDLFWEGAQEASIELSHFPWAFSVRAGAESVRSWNLPEAAGNPLFGLPALSHQDHPEQPFRFLERYRSTDAPIFFGRSRYVRDLYDRATDPLSAPIILCYGQSGVGKSSMLEAGLFPRLSQTCEVLYIRRDATLGLLGTMQNALGVGNGPAPALENAADALQKKAKKLEELAHGATGDLRTKLLDALQIMQDKAKEAAMTLPAQDHSIREAWKRREAATGKPLVVLLDQVEEMYTKPAQGIPKETEEALAEVYHLFAHPELRPKGKLILSYRKEYHPEIEDAFKALQLPREHVFIRKLQREDIAEVVAGLSSTEQLQRAYRLQIDSHLPEIIADDLLEDEESAVAPVLQILLTKMWLLTAGDEVRTFSISRYQQLKKDGILMEDFFEEQMEKLRAWNEEVERSGLGLDILYFHTTELATAGVHSMEELRQRYAHQQAVLDALLTQFQNLYLLIRTDGPNNAFALAHDTLAPLVQRAFRHSDTPGHRASRVLESKKAEFAKNPDNLLNATDLHLVEQGQNGMPVWEELERTLVAKSKALHEKQRRFKRRVRQGLIFGSTLIALLGGLATVQWRTAVQQREKAEQETIAANLLRMQAELDLERNNKNPQIAGKLKAVFERYPNHPVTRQLLYKNLLPFGQSERERAQPYAKEFAHANHGVLRKLYSMNGGGHGERLALDVANKAWHLEVEGPSSLYATAIDADTTYAIAVTIPDLGGFMSVDMHPVYPVIAVVGDDGLVRVLGTNGVLLWASFRSDEPENRITEAVFETGSGDLLLHYANEQVTRTPMELDALIKQASPKLNLP